MIQAAAMLLAAAAASGCTARSDQPLPAADQSHSGLQQIPLTIQSGTRTHRFQVEVARTPEEQAQGLMHRRSLDPDRGMLFPYAAPQETAFWMKNTLIPLDIIFIRPDGTIARIAANTTPLSLEPVPSFEPISAVLEIPGGRAAEIGLEPGDKVSWRD